MDFTEKQIPALLLLSTSKKLSGIAEIPPYAQKTVPAVFAKARELELEIAGPEVFIYHFHDQGMDLRIGVPVKAKRGDPGEFEFFTAAPVNVLSTVYSGSMKTIGKGWDDLNLEVKRRKVPCTNECREAYLVWKDFDSADNRTELQRVRKA